MKPFPSIEYQCFLDACEWVCPMPLLKTKRQLQMMTSGQVLYVQSVDAGSWQDIPKYIRQSDHQLLSCYESEQTYHFWIRCA